ncbi:type II secretion system protein [Chloroflexota bacterium]
MIIPKRWEKGFTLIELLIVVAILGVLAAVVIPNVGRFIGRGETEARETELANIQSAVVSMMVDNGIDALPNPISTGTNDMNEFPSPNSTESTLDYVLFSYTGNTSINYVVTQLTTANYTVNAQGTVSQVPE